MNKEVFKEVKWLPMPKLYDSEDKEEEKYLKFDEAYINLDKPDDCDRPGNTYLPKKTENTLVPKPNWRRYGQRIRKIIWCEECGKPRLIFSKNTLEDDIDIKIDRVLENFSYTCGGPIVPEGHEFEKLIFVEAYINCSKSI